MTGSVTYNSSDQSYSQQLQSSTIPGTAEVTASVAGVTISNKASVTFLPVYIPPDMVLVPAGMFSMGDNFNEGDPDELPVHAVYLDAYYIGTYEVTNSDFAAFLNAKGNQGHGDVNWYYDISGSVARIELESGSYIAESGYENHPVVLVNWYGAVAYCNWLSEKEGLETCYGANYNVDVTKKGYRLPTEAEWEKAARGDAAKNSSLGHQRRYPWGDEIDGSYANYLGSDDPYEAGLTPTTPVGYYDGSFRNGFQTSDGRSPYGAHDMAGNVWEWCNDWYGSSYYSTSPFTSPLGVNSGNYRVLRGGGWYNGCAILRCALRTYYFPFPPHYTLDIVGFRIARTR